MIAPRDAVLIGFVLAMVRGAWQFLEWLSRVYVLTDMRMIRVRGVLRVSVFETPLKNIQHTRMVLTLRERPFGLGSIAFATAGTAASTARLSYLSMRPRRRHVTSAAPLRRGTAS